MNYQFPEIDKESYALIHAEAAAIVAALEDRDEKAAPLRGLLNEAQNIIAAYDHKAQLEVRLDRLNRHNAPAYFNELIARLGATTEGSLADISADLDARLVKQAQALDTMHDLLLYLSQYALAQDTAALQSHINLALRAQDQSARTIEKFRKLQEKRVKTGERKEGIGNEKRDNDLMD